MLNTRVFMAASVLVLSADPNSAWSSDATTTVTVSIPDDVRQVSPLIYGQMYEHVDDPMVYDGVVNKDGSERPHVTRLLKDLEVPAVRWPGGTLIHEYLWENGIGPIDSRKETYCERWKNYDNNRFGTDEFLAHCEELGTEPYITFNMSNADVEGNSLRDALNWMEYVLGDQDSQWGSERAKNGRSEPYHVRYWGLGNENYGSFGINKAESVRDYSARAVQWASAIKKEHPNVSLLGVGQTGNLTWNQEVLAAAGKHIDWLTLHIYTHIRFNKGEIESDPRSSLFAPVRARHYLGLEVENLKQYNQKHRSGRPPVRICIDEWNNRHEIKDHQGTYGELMRMSPRRQVDVAIGAGMLNTFIHHSPHVGMANYIFPVNAHGLIRTEGDHEAYQTPLFYVFQKYRQLMRGRVADVEVSGPSVTRDFPLAITIKNKFSGNEKSLTWIDSVAVVSSDDKRIVVSLVNRSTEENHRVLVNIPKGYSAVGSCRLESDSIYATNTLQTQAVRPVESTRVSFPITIKPCGLVFVICQLRE